jgi:hypothetical protein
MSVTVTTTPGQLNNSVVQGATFRRRLTYKQASDSTPINLTGYTAKMQIRDASSNVLILELSTTNGRITLGGTAGTIDLLIAATDTDDFTPGCYIYDLELLNGTEVLYLVQGQFDVLTRVTV